MFPPPLQSFHLRELEIEYVWTKFDTFDTGDILDAPHPGDHNHDMIPI